MLTQLNITKLIQETELLVHDDKINNAAIGERSIQLMQTEDGDVYQLKIVLELVKSKTINHDTDN